MSNHQISRVNARKAFLNAAAVGVVALVGALQIPSCMAAERIDPHIFSSVPFTYTADRGIFTAVSEERLDARIFSPVSESGSADVQNREGAPVRYRHDI
jgi:hypothetical protein